MGPLPCHHQEASPCEPEGGGRPGLHLMWRNLSVYHMPGKLNPADNFTKELKDIDHFKRVHAPVMSPRFPMAMGARGC